MPNAPKEWQPPGSDQEFVFKDIQSAPEWIDRSWASYDMGPALALPQGDVLGEQAYTTQIARVGDTVKFMAATKSKAAHFEVIPGEPEKVGEDTKRPPQETSATLEDQLKGGTLDPGDLGSDAKAQVAARSPMLKDTVEGKQDPAPKKK
jgi:hypothetical protein